MMVYGIISAKDNQTSLAYFKSKKISKGNLVTADRLKILAKALHSGDVVNVDRFLSVNMFVAFAGIVLESGTSMKIVDQPYKGLTERSMKNGRILVSKES